MGGGEKTALRDTGATGVTFLAEGRLGTVMAGYGDGLFGLWRADNGKRLLSEKLHGPIVEVKWRDSTVRVASALGEIRDIDLSAFDIPYCELLSRVWQTIPVTWENDLPVVRPPGGHPSCEIPERPEERLKEASGR